MPAFKAIFAGAAIGTLVLVAVNQRALWPFEVAALEQPYEAPAPKSDRLDGLVKLREAMMRAAPRRQPEAAFEPPVQQAALSSTPGAVSGLSLIAHPKIGDDSVEVKSLALVYPDADQPLPATRDASGNASSQVPVTQDFRYLIYNVWSFAQGHSGRNAGRGD